MKVLNSLLLFILLHTSTVVLAQDDVYSSINSLDITIDSVEELESLDWDELVSVFGENAAKDSVSIGIKIKDLTALNKLGDTVLLNNLEVRVKGVSSNLESIRKDLKKARKGMLKFIENMKN